MKEISKILASALIATSIFCAIQVPVFARQGDYKFKQFTTEHGLSNGIINCTFKDSDGFIWFGTQNGLNRYDSHGIKVYQYEIHNNASISSNKISSIIEDSEGNLWVGTFFGLNKFDKKTETFQRFFFEEDNPNSLSSNEIKCLAITASDDLLIGTPNAGINFYDHEDNQFTRYLKDDNQPGSLGDNTVYDILQESSTEFWVCSDIGGIELFDLTTGTFRKKIYDDNSKRTTMV